MDLAIKTVDSAPSELLDSECRYSAVRLSPRRLLAVAADVRWNTRWTVARAAGRLVGAVTSHRPKNAQVVGGRYDLRALEGSLAGTVPDDARRWVFVGGCRDLAAGVLTSAKLGDQSAAEVCTALAGHVFTEARAAGDYPVALYVRDQEVDSFTTGLAERAITHRIAETADLVLVGESEDEHLASLEPAQRGRYRRDKRRFAELPYTAECVPASATLAEAAPLVCAVKAKHGVIDHPRLCEYRLREWLNACGPGNCHASVVRDSDGRLMAVSLFVVHGKVLEGYEIGLADNVDGRVFAYLQAMIHGPVRFAFDHGCRRIDLGLSASTVKQRRGAVIGSTWAISHE